MNETCTVVVTTINDPALLEEYYENFKRFGHLDMVRVVVIPDLKTPQKAYERIDDLKKRGLNIVCPTINEQEVFLKRVEFSPTLIPYNSDNRRNVGYLMALENGSDFIISIDDDNICTEDVDFFREHAVVCEDLLDVDEVSVDTGWYNIAELLVFDKSGVTYPRGFPYFARHKSNAASIKRTKGRVRINAGMWLLDPDVDGISWLVNPMKVSGFGGKSIVLSTETWSPVNTQNTALHREVIPSYYFVKMGYPLGNSMIDRYGDIFSGYFAQACAKKLGDGIRFGTPVANHVRNSHNYMNDAHNEWGCIMALEDLLPWLRECKLEGKNYSEVYESLSYALEEVVEGMKGKIWTDATRGYFHQMAFHMRRWLDAIRCLDVA